MKVQALVQHDVVIDRRKTAVFPGQFYDVPDEAALEGIAEGRLKAVSEFENKAVEKPPQTKGLRGAASR